jgi:hypothetical protein
MSNRHDRALPPKTQGLLGVFATVGASFLPYHPFCYQFLFDPLKHAVVGIM